MRDKSSSQRVMCWTDTRTDRLQDWTWSPENLDLWYKGLLQREWNTNRKEAPFIGGSLG